MLKINVLENKTVSPSNSSNTHSQTNVIPLTSVKNSSPNEEEKVNCLIDSILSVINSTLFIKNKKTKVQNLALLTKFVSSVSSIFDEKQLIASAKSVDLNRTAPMTLSDLRIMIDRMENFYGVGDAKNMPRNVQINIWPNKNPFSHPGHVSMEVKNKHKHENIYISLFPDEPAKLLMGFEKFRGYLSKDYKSDAASEISFKTCEKLNKFDQLKKAKKNGTIIRQLYESIDINIDEFFYCDGKIKENIFFDISSSFSQGKEKFIENILKKLSIIEETKHLEKIYSRINDIILNEYSLVSEGMLLNNEGKSNFITKIRENISDDNEIYKAIHNIVDSLLKERTYFVPNMHQKKSPTGDWLIDSEKVFLPLRGKQKEKNFVMFGLDEESMTAYFEKINKKIADGKIGYRMISKDENCAGMVAGFLATGGARYFMPFKSGWFADTPNDIHRYALQVQNKIDTLNQKSKQIQGFYLSEQQSKNSTLSVESCMTKFNLAINEMSSTEKRRFSVLATAVKKVSGQEKNANEMMHKSILFVEELSDLLDSQPEDTDKNSPIHQALLSAAGLLELAWLRHKN